jgi:hypothetical protein
MRNDGICKHRIMGERGTLCTYQLSFATMNAMQMLTQEQIEKPRMLRAVPLENIGLICRFWWN